MSDFDPREEQLKLDPTYRFYEQIRDGKAAPNLRMDAAKGLIPFDNVIFGRVLGLLLRERKNRELLLQVFKTVKGMPEELVEGFVRERETDPNLIDAIARVFSSEEGILRQIVLNRATSDKTIAFVAGKCPPSVQSLIANNEERLLRYPEIVDSLFENPRIDPDIRMRVLLRQEERIQQAEVRGEDVSDFLEEEVEEVDVDEEIDWDDEDDDWDEEEEENEWAPQPGQMPPGMVPPQGAPPTIDPSQLFDKDVSEMTPEELAAYYQAVQAQGEDGLEDEDEDDIAIRDDELSEEEEQDLAQKINNMNQAEKEVLARLGNGAARNLLIRDPAKSVALAVIDSPKVTEDEIQKFAKLKSVSKDVLRAIGRHREWSKYYGVRHALVMNPLTPLDVAMSLMRTLFLADIQKLQKSREVSGAIQNHAKKIVKQKEKRQGG